MTEPEARDRLLAALRDDPPPTRGQLQRRAAATMFTGFVAASLVFLLVGVVYFRHGFDGPVWEADQRDPMLIAVTFAGTLVIAYLATRLSFARGGRMGGRSLELLVGTIVAVPAAYLAWKVGWSWWFDSSQWWADRPGYKCMDLSLLTSGVLFVALIAARRGRCPDFPGSTGAALGIASGAASAVLLDLWCPVGHAQHVMTGHVLPMLLYGVLGYFAGRRFLP